jgi:hypothetical protein
MPCRTVLTLTLLGTLVGPSIGCIAAAAAGAAGGIYATSRGVESLINAPIEDAATRSRAVMGDMGIGVNEEHSEKGGDRREFKGKHGDTDVTVQLRRESPTTTKVEVSARKNVAEWDKDFARRVLTRIVEAQ